MGIGSIQFNACKGLLVTLPEIGKLKIGRQDPDDSKMRKSGDRSWRLPQKLSYIHVTTRLKGPHDQWITDEEVTKQLPENPTEIPITVVYNDPVLNTQSRLCCYRGSKRWCHGDNETALRLDDKGIYRKQVCPCPLLTSPGDDPINHGIVEGKWTKCKFNGVFRCQIPLKKSSQGVYGFRTTSAESISNILGVQMSVLMHTRIWAKGGLLSGLPLRFRIYASTDNTPGGASTSWKATLDLPVGGWDEIDESCKRLIQHQLSASVTMQVIEAGYREKLKAIGAGDLSAEALLDELYPRPSGDGEERDEEQETDKGPAGSVDAQVESTPKESTAAPTPPPEKKEEPKPTTTAAPTSGAAAQTQDPPKPTEAQINQALADEAGFKEAFEAETDATMKGMKDMASAMLWKQVHILKRMLERTGYDGIKPDALPIEQWRPEYRQQLFDKLSGMPAKPVQDSLPWDEAGEAKK